MLEIVSRQVGTVGIGWREVSEDAGAVDSFPPERMVRELIDLIPRNLLG